MGSNIAQLTPQPTPAKTGFREEDGICALSAVAMAELIRAGRLSARETLEAHLNRIERINPAVNAIVTLAPDAARRHAAEADEAQAHGESIGLLHGLPIAHKDLQLTRGIRTTFGSPIFRDFVPTENSPFIDRIEAAGAIAIGKTNTPEFGAGSQTFNPVFGPTLNPWDTSKTCGGSSGGAATSLATHMLPLADGTDMGGSLRNPASFCGIVGLRPSAGRVPSTPDVLAALTLSVEGPMARSVADLALFLQAIAEPCEAFAKPLARDFRGVRIAWWQGMGGIPVDPQVRDLTDAQRGVFESLGCIVEEAEPDLEDADEVFRTLRAFSISLRFGALAKRHPGRIKDTILWELECASKLTTDRIGQALQRQEALCRHTRRFMERYEFFVLPVSQALPFDVNLPFPPEIDGTKMETYIDWMKTCYLISVLGTPAISVPAAFTAEGLPVGIQIVGRHRDDFGLLQMAHAFESARNLTQRSRGNFDPPL